MQESREELDEFQEGSRELEHELETQLEQAEARQKELLAAKARLESENESLKVEKEKNIFIFQSSVYQRLLVTLSRIIY